MATGRPPMVLVLIHCFLQPSIAQIINCTVTHQVNQTFYSVPDVSASHCEYSWAYASDTKHTVLAHQEGKNGTLVRINNISIVITSECFDRIIYERNCVSEGTHYTAICTIDCNASSSPVKDKENYIWIVPAAVIAAVLLLLAVVMSYRYRDRILKKICSYASVKTEPDVELG